MQSLWNDQDAAHYQSPLALRVYTSRLLGCEPSLVLHGGGNTSVKDTVENLFGQKEEILFVKGSGWDLATIEEPGFAPVKMDVLLEMAKLTDLSDTDMVKYQRAAMIDPSAPNPSVEAILHAIIPFKFVDHTHADAIVTLTNTPEREAFIQTLYGKRILIIPYVMPGFILARTVYEMTKEIDWQSLDGLVLMNHGLFTFADDAKTSYENTIKIVAEAEAFLAERNAIFEAPAATVNYPSVETITKVRHKLSALKQSRTIVHFEGSAVTQAFASHAELARIAQQGPLTPDHVIRTKRLPALLSDDSVETQLDKYVEDYVAYFNDNVNGEQCLNPAPNFSVLENHGLLTFGKNIKEAKIIADIARHTCQSILNAEQLSSYKALSAAEIFEVEYWELEQAKLKKSGGSAPLQGAVCAVFATDKEQATEVLKQLAVKGAQSVLVLPSDDVKATLKAAVYEFGGIDLCVSVGVETFDDVVDFLRLGLSPRIVAITTETSELLDTYDHADIPCNAVKTDTVNSALAAEIACRTLHADYVSTTNTVIELV